MAHRCNGTLTIIRTQTNGHLIVNTYGTGGKTPEWITLTINGRYNLDPLPETLSYFQITDQQLYANFLGVDHRGKWQGEFKGVLSEPHAHWFDYVVPLFPSRFQVEVTVELTFKEVATGRQFQRRHEMSLGPLRPDQYGLFDATRADHVTWEFGKPVGRAR